VKVRLKKFLFVGVDFDRKTGLDDFILPIFQNWKTRISEWMIAPAKGPVQKTAFRMGIRLFRILGKAICVF